MTPGKRQLLDLLREEQSRDKDDVSYVNTFKPRINFKVVGFVILALAVFYLSFKFVGGENDKVAEPVVYSILARSADAENLELVQKLGTKLVELGYTVELARRKVSSAGVVFELYVDASTSQESLNESLVRLQTLTLNGLGGVRPFADAQISPFPKN
ncbi:MAG: hypothetical protein ACI84O_000343 [Myxococcota bacterium]|jgi:hypothetical protein